MTRKRFIKLLMSLGVTRNSANDFATIVTDGNYFPKSYQVLWDYSLNQYNSKDGCDSFL